MWYIIGFGAVLIMGFLAYEITKAPDFNKEYPGYHAQCAMCNKGNCEGCPYYNLKGDEFTAEDIKRLNS